MKNKTPRRSRREFLKKVAGASGMALAGGGVAAPAKQRPRTPMSLTYLDRRTYIRNMEVVAQFGPGTRRGGKMQMMSIGDRRYMFQAGDVIDVSDARKPHMYKAKGFEGGTFHL